MNQNYLRIYQEIIEKLKNDQRPKIVLTTELMAELRAEWESALSATNLDSIKKILCILDNTQTTTSELNELFFKTLKQIKDQEILVYTLAASQKHVIADSFKTGHMISYEYFEILKNLLLDKNPEVKEWALRTIENLGPLSMRFQKEVLAAKPGLIKLFNQHQKASAQIIEYLEKEWKRMKL
ncbi:MAG: hypothetical protein H7336_07235 [Bacteriovorax sp.]|nr:hypothetical protein [Bacteriovorax sp.]